MKRDRLFIFMILMGLFMASELLGQNRGEEMANSEKGATLYDTLRCGMCHDVEARGVNIPPSLKYAGSKFQRPWLESYLKGPNRRRWARAGVRPILRMPDFLLSEEEAQHLSTFLSTRKDTARFAELPFELVTSDSAVAEGKALFDEYACRGCHTVEGKGGEIGPDLTHVGSRLRPGYMAAFLKDPQAIIPGTAMKDFDFWEEELQAMIAYLVALK